MRLKITSLKIDAAAVTTVVRGGTYSFKYIAAAPGAYESDVKWAVINAAYATVNDDGSITISNKTGTVVLTATDTISGLESAIVLRII